MEVCNTLGFRRSNGCCEIATAEDNCQNKSNLLLQEIDSVVKFEVTFVQSAISYLQF